MVREMVVTDGAELEEAEAPTVREITRPATPSTTTVSTIATRETRTLAKLAFRTVAGSNRRTRQSVGSYGGFVTGTGGSAVPQ
jgi:hypothetical protein